MRQNLSAGFRSEIVQESFFLGQMVEIEFEEATVRATNYGYDLDYDGFTFLDLGDLLAVRGVAENTPLQNDTWTITLSGVERVNLAIALTTNYIDRPASYWLVTLDEQGAVHPLSMKKGLTDGWSVSDEHNGTTVLNITVTSRWGDIDGKNGRHTNHEEQSKSYDGDRGFSLIDQRVREFVWG